MRLVMTVDVDLEGTDLDPEDIKAEMWNFTKDLLFYGNIICPDVMKLQKVECEGVTWTRQ